jgi:hypothetical protein
VLTVFLWSAVDAFVVADFKDNQLKSIVPKVERVPAGILHPTELT